MAEREPAKKAWSVVRILEILVIAALLILVVLTFLGPSIGQRYITPIPSI